MKNDSTPASEGQIKINSATNATFDKLSPRQSTLAMLRQFARAYTCATTLPVAIGSFVAN